MSGVLAFLQVRTLLPSVWCLCLTYERTVRHVCMYCPARAKLLEAGRLYRTGNTDRGSPWRTSKINGMKGGGGFERAYAHSVAMIRFFFCLLAALLWFLTEHWSSLDGGTDTLVGPLTPSVDGKRPNQNGYFVAPVFFSQQSNNSRLESKLGPSSRGIKVTATKKT